MQEFNTINGLGCHKKSMMNETNKLIMCYQKTGLSLAQFYKTIPSSLLETKLYIENVHRLLQYKNNTVVNQYNCQEKILLLIV